MKRLLLISIMLFVLEMPKCLPPVQAAEEELLDRVVAVVARMDYNGNWHSTTLSA